MDRKVFYDRVRGTLFDGSMTASQVGGMEHILDALQGQPLRWMAYSLATAHHEVGRTMQPVREGFKKTDAGARIYVKNNFPHYGKPDGPYGHFYYGRGYVQLTWLANYQKASEVVGLDLVKTPDLALDPFIAAKIMRDGMEKGWFTKRKLADYIPAADDAVKQEDVGARYVAARRVINGTDKAALIAGYATKYEAALRAAGYSPTGFRKPASNEAAKLNPVEPKPQIPVIPAGEPVAVPVPRDASPSAASQPGLFSRFISAFIRRWKGQ